MLFSYPQPSLARHRSSCLLVELLFYKSLLDLLSQLLDHYGSIVYASKTTDLRGHRHIVTADNIEASNLILFSSQPK